MQSVICVCVCVNNWLGLSRLGRPHWTCDVVCAIIGGDVGTYQSRHMVLWAAPAARFRFASELFSQVLELCFIIELVQATLLGAICHEICPPASQSSPAGPPRRG